MDNISLVSTNYLSIRKDDFSKGRSLVKFFVEYDEESETFNLYRTGQILLPGQDSDGSETARYLLCKNVRSLVFTYVDDDGNSQEEWAIDETEDAPGKVDDTGKNLPSLLYIRLELGESGQEARSVSVFQTALSFSSFKGEGQ